LKGHMLKAHRRQLKIGGHIRENVVEIQTKSQRVKIIIKTNRGVAPSNECTLKQKCVCFQLSQYVIIFFRDGV
jgi:hypothetical protein